MHLQFKLTTMRYLLTVCFALTILLLAFRPSQDLRVSGFVKDENGFGLAHVSVSEVHSKNKTFTAADGSFTLKISSRHALLTFQLAGYEKAEFSLSDIQKPIQIELKSAVQPVEDTLSDQKFKSIEKEDMNSVPLPAPSILSYGTAGINTRRAEYYRNKASMDKKYFQPSAKQEEFNTEEYDAIVENRFLTAVENPLSTFSIDVDGGSYSNVRRYLLRGQMPPSGAVRVEEMINYFHYDYPQPKGDVPFSINTELGICAWNPHHRLVMIGLQGRKIPVENLPASNLVFLIDVSGSMMQPEKLPLVQRSLKMLVDQLREQDRVSLVVYAGNAGLVLPSTSGAEKTKIKNAIDHLEAGGSTAGGAGIRLAYKVAGQHFITGGNNRVILCTDGDFNIGPSSDSDLMDIIEKERKSGVFLTVLGYGMGNYKDSKMEKLADKGNGNHSYIDNEKEAKKVLVNEFGGTLFTIAKDVKLQIEFNPGKVQAYRLVGYENRMLNKEDFNNDQKDAGELGSGHTVTALYEIIPVGEKNEFLESVDPLKYQQRLTPDKRKEGDDLMTIKFRYKNPDGDKSMLIVHTVADKTNDLTETSVNFRFVSAVAQFGMLLRNSEFKQQASYEKTYSLAKNAIGQDTEGYRAEFLQLVRGAGKMAKNSGIIPEDEVYGIK